MLLREASPVLAQAERAMDTVLRAARGEAVQLRVGFLSSLANELMPPLVRLLAERQPDIDLHTEDLPIAAIVAGVREGSLDAAISRPRLVDDLDTEVLGSEPVASRPLGHRRATQQADAWPTWPTRRG